MLLPHGGVGAHRPPRRGGGVIREAVGTPPTPRSDRRSGVRSATTSASSAGSEAHQCLLVHAGAGPLPRPPVAHHRGTARPRRDRGAADRHRSGHAAEQPPPRRRAMSVMSTVVRQVGRHGLPAAKMYAKNSPPRLVPPPPRAPARRGQRVALPAPVASAATAATRPRGTRRPRARGARRSSRRAPRGLRRPARAAPRRPTGSTTAAKPASPSAKTEPGERPWLFYLPATIP